MNKPRINQKCKSENYCKMQQKVGVSLGDLSFDLLFVIFSVICAEGSSSNWEGITLDFRPLYLFLALYGYSCKII